MKPTRIAIQLSGQELATAIALYANDQGNDLATLIFEADVARAFDFWDLDDGNDASEPHRYIIEIALTDLDPQTTIGPVAPTDAETPTS